MFDYLPEKIISRLTKYDLKNVTELRLRVNLPVSVQVKGKYYLENVIFTKSDMESTLLKITKRSLYTYTDTILNGYLYGECGERIGISGTFIYQEGILKSIKDYSSLCIRLPHEIIGCANKIYDICFINKLSSILVISPPGGGKTTILRDLARQISLKLLLNVLIIDEKKEIAGNGNFDIGKTCDVLSLSKKAFGFNHAIVNMRPDIIITDELTSYQDILGSKNAVLSGVKVLASAHADNYNQLLNRQLFKSLIEEKIFDYVVCLSKDNYPGEIVDIFKL